MFKRFSRIAAAALVSLAGLVPLLAGAAPVVSLTSPANNSTYTAPASISLAASASDSASVITRVEFYKGATLLGSDTTSPYSLALSNVSAGTYSYTAKVYNKLGASTVSAPVNVTVRPPNLPPAVTGLTASPVTLLDTATSQLQVTASDADAGPNALTHAWRIVSGGGSLNDSTLASPIYTPGDVVAPTAAVISVSVSDGAATTSQSITLTVNDANPARETVVYYHNDALGSPIAATDASGTLLWRESYRPYGERLSNQAAAGINPIWYTGKRQDPETGLVYMGARYYNPMLGRFLSIDPIEPDENNLHSLNRYAYANNNPYKFVDPDGQAAETIIDVISLGLSIQAYRQDPGFINGLAVAYDGFATAIPFLPGGIGIIRQAASKGSEITQAVRQAADGGASNAVRSADSAKGAASTLPRMKGMGQAELDKTLTNSGFTKTRVSSSAGKNETWSHADGSEVRIHPYGNVKKSPYKSGNNGHLHKQDSAGNPLTDLGTVSQNPSETHIGIPNPRNFPSVRGRAHGE